VFSSLTSNDGSLSSKILGGILNPFCAISNLINPPDTTDYITPLIQAGTIIDGSILTIVIISFVIK
jgi:hypothetical protein